MASTSQVEGASPSRMTEPLPNCFSIWPSAADSAFLRFSSIESASMGACGSEAIMPQVTVCVYSGLWVNWPGMAATKVRQPPDSGIEQQLHGIGRCLPADCIPVAAEASLQGHRSDAAFIEARRAGKPYQP